MLFQIIFLLFSGGAIMSVFRQNKSGYLSRRAASFWIFLWMLADIFVLLPNSATVIANHFGIGRGSDFIFYIAIAVFFFVLFRLHVKIEIINRDITKVVRRDAIEHPSTQAPKHPSM